MIDTLIIVSIVLVMLFGLFLVIQMLRSKTYKGDDESLEYKDELPILPRDQRVVPDLPVPNEKVEQEIKEEPDALSNLAMAVSKMELPDDKDDQEPKEEPSKQENLVNVSSEFTQNSPLLDSHLGQERHFDQNNDPLLNAKDTVTLFISPRNHSIGLSGREILEIARVYGLKYGVMNMYHRYENETAQAICGLA